jgi:formate dehydrogenase major subunit
MGLRETFLPWPVLRQAFNSVRGGDRSGRGEAVRSRATGRLEARTKTADRVVKSVCPYCAVGCGQLVYVQDDKVVQIEGDPASPVSRGRLCPKGAASKQLADNPLRETKVRYRRPYGTEWEELDLGTAMNMIADRVVATRRDTFVETDDQDRRVRRTMGIAMLGGATLDNEENYLIKKLGTALGAVQIENQARI